MRNLGAETVIAIDVGAVDEKNLTNYGDFLDGWSLLWNKIWPWAQPVRVSNSRWYELHLTYTVPLHKKLRRQNVLLFRDLDC